MSQKFPGGFITKSPVAPTTTAASGIWTLDQQEQYQQAGTWPSPPPPPYIEDVFSTYLYTGTGSTQTITNNINLASKGGLTWIKARTDVSASPQSNALFDTARGVSNRLQTDTTAAQYYQAGAYLTSFNSSGFDVAAQASTGASAAPYVSWTFRKQPKFFDVVTWTGDGVAGRQIAHNLGSAPGAIIVKCTSTARDWAVWQNTLTDGTYLKLNTTDSVITNTSFQVFGDASGQTSTYFTVGKSGSGVNGLTNANGDTYVAYIFAHNAGGFGATETESVISCGSYTTDSSGNATVTLGWEPQWFLGKTTGVENWWIQDTMRGWNVGGVDSLLLPNSNDAEFTYDEGYPTATGFVQLGAAPSTTYIYIAIRRGPMKTPTTGTSVFSPSVYNTSPSSPLTVTTNFPVDLSISTDIQGGQGQVAVDRLRGVAASSLKFLQPNTTAAEASSTGMSVQSNTALIDSGFWAGYSYKPVYWNFRRAPSFFDEVCYTGTGSATTFNHNLGVTPELMIVKRKSTSGNNWAVYSSFLTATNRVFLNTTAATSAQTSIWNDTEPTSSVFTVGTNDTINASGSTYVAYLFATCAGVSKVGSYTGTGAAQTINCGFTSGARFLLIKRTDSTGDWYTYDSARGITSGNDPYLLMNSTAAQVSGTNYVDSDTTGFTLTSSAPAALNASGGSYIYLAIS